MGQPIDIGEKFNQWYNEVESFSLRSERLEDDISLIRSDAVAPEKRLEMVKRWLMAAYRQGAVDMADDTLDTLGDYGTACAGLDEKVYTRTEAYDAAAESLREYYKVVKDD